MKLYKHQLDALDKMKNGCILNGGVGSGKSITSVAYYYLKQGGSREFLTGGDFVKPKMPKDLYIITTAQKRNNLEWEGEISRFLLSIHPETNAYDNKVVIDSWNNIQKYRNVTDAFFIFDEQRVCGSGAWSKAFIKISKFNDWILLSATPGDTWSDYIPVFIANGFYKNKTEFLREHAVFSRFAKFPQIEKYIGTGRLLRYRNSILINMDFERKTVQHHKDIYVNYNVEDYKFVMKNRWDLAKQEPIENSSALCYNLRRIVNSDESRQKTLLDIYKEHPKMIIFYNFDYELEILKGLDYGGATVAEYNGHRHDPVPTTDKWIYLVQYTAGNAGWNCITTDTIVFYSQNYSYKVMEQSSGRIDRLNTPYIDLYYYHLKTRSNIDLAIAKALRDKKKFNEAKWVSSRL